MKFVQAVPAEGGPALPLVAGREVQAEHQPRPPHTGLHYCLGHRLEGGEAVTDVLELGGGRLGAAAGRLPVPRVLQCVVQCTVVRQGEAPAPWRWPAGRNST